MGDVLRVVGTRLRSETELGANESRRHLRYDLLGRMRVRTEAVGELAIEPVARARKVAELMGKHAHVPEVAVHGRRADEGFLLRHRDLVGRQRVEGAVSAVIDPCTCARNEAVEVGRPAHGTEIRLFGRRRREPVDLRCIEDGGCAQNAALAVVIVSRLLDIELTIEDDLRGRLALAHLRANAGPLLVAGPQTRRMLLHVGGNPEHQDVDAAIGAFRGRVLRNVQRAARRPVPRHDGIARTGLDLLQDRRGDAIMDGVFVCHGDRPRCGPPDAASTPAPLHERH